MTKNWIDALNEDENSVRLLNEFNEQARKHNITGDAYKHARISFVMAILYSNKKAFSMLAEETYNKYLEGVQQQ